MGRQPRKRRSETEIHTAALVKLELLTYLFTSGQIPFDVYWRAKQQVEPEAQRELREIKRWAIEEARLLTPEEWEELRRKYRDEHGDSFVHFLNAARQNAVFVTNNPKILADRRKLQKRFGVKIVSGAVFQKKMGEQAKEMLDALVSELLGRPRPA